MRRVFLPVKPPKESLMERKKNCINPSITLRPIEDEKIQNLSLRFTLSQGVTAAIPPGDPPFLPIAVHIARGAVALSSDELEKIKSLSSGVAPLFSA